MSSTDVAVFDTLAFRRSLGMFATGIAVVTTIGTDGRPLGLTINSFNSVSLKPPLILWSLAKAQSNRIAFEGCEHYAINVLSSGQQALSQRFASREADRFAGLDNLGEGIGGIPLLPDCLAWFECRNATRYEGGDHLIFLGEVVDFAKRDGEPLLYYSGAYRTLAPA